MQGSGTEAHAPKRLGALLAAVHGGVISTGATGLSSWNAALHVTTAAPDRVEQPILVRCGAQISGEVRLAQLEHRDPTEGKARAGRAKRALADSMTRPTRTVTGSSAVRVAISAGSSAFANQTPSMWRQSPSASTPDGPSAPGADPDPDVLRADVPGWRAGSAWPPACGRGRRVLEVEDE